MKKVAIIGGGISGLTCAKFLDPSIFETTIFDKSRSVGGRVSTRRYEDYHFDHGAQYLEETNSPFKHELKRWLDAEVIAPWEAKLGTLEGSRFVNTFKDKLTYVGVPKMSAIPNHLRDQLDHVNFKFNVKIDELFKKFNEWYLVDQGEDIIGPFDFLVIAIPSHQASVLLSDFPYLQEILNEVEFGPRWAIMIGLTYRLNIDYDAIFIKNSPIRWMARNNSKPGRPNAESWVVHATKEWSQKNIERGQDWITAQLFGEFLNITGFESYETKYKQVHLWRYGIVDNPLNQNFILDNNRNIALCGDYCVGNNIEAAFISGENLAERLNSLRI